MPDAGSKYTDRQLKELDHRIRGIYTEARVDILKKMEDFNRRHKVKEAIYTQQLKDGKITQDDLDAWKRGQVFQGKQWQDKLDSILYTLHHSNEIAIDMINDRTPQVFAVNGNYMSYSIEHGERINFGFNLYDVNTVTRLIRDNPKLLPEWKIDEQKDYVWNYKKVNNSITQGIIQGESLDKIATRLSTGLSAQNRNTMLTFAQTAMTEAQSAGRIESMRQGQKLGINVEKMWIAVGDGRTRHAHMDLDGQTQALQDPFESDLGDIMYPGDPNANASNTYNCRCTLGYEHPDYNFEEWEGQDTINGEYIWDMDFEEWMDAKAAEQSDEFVEEEEEELEFTQVGIGKAKSVEDINKLLNTPGLFRSEDVYDNYRYDRDQMKWVYDVRHKQSMANLNGCDLDSAKAIAAAYEQIFSRFPHLKGQFDAPNAQPVNMKDNTYAWCYINTGGMVQVNPNKYNNWQSVVSRYEKDVGSGWHPFGTTAESIVTHEVGHAIDGLLARKGVLGGRTASGEYRYASSSMKTTVMKRAAKSDEEIAQWMNGDKWQRQYAIQKFVSTYAAQNAQEWFAECFAEYITSASPRTVAAEFGKELERLVEKLK